MRTRQQKAEDREQAATFTRHEHDPGNSALWLELFRTIDDAAERIAGAIIDLREVLENAP